MQEFDLERFVRAQDAGGTFDRVMRELEAGRKHSHLMWFVFPQIAGLGSSGIATNFAISSLDEAAAYLAHPVLGVKLRSTTERVLNASNRTAAEIFGPIDTMKLRSSMTLFLRADPEEVLFALVIDRYFEGAPDPLTDQLLDLGG